MVLLLLTFCSLLLPLWESVIVLCFVVHYLCPFLFCNHLDGEDRAECFALFVLLVSRDGCVVLPCGAMELSVVCDCGIFYHTHLLLLKG